MAKLLDSVKEYLTPTFIAEAARQLGEEETSTAKALQGLSATILAGLLDQVNHPETLERLYHQLQQFPPHLIDDPEVLLRPGNLAHHDPKDLAGHWMGQFFGARMPAMTNGIAAFSGAKVSSVSFLSGVAGPVVMSLLQHRIQASTLNASGLANLLLADRDRILAALPSGLGAILGLHPAEAPAENAPVTATDMQWVWPLLLLLGIGGGIMVYLRACGG